MEKKYRWIDDSVKIDFPLPEKVQEVVDNCEKYDLARDLGRYIAESDWLDVYAKRWIGAGLTQEQYDLLRYRYQ